VQDDTDQDDQPLDPVPPQGDGDADPTSRRGFFREALAGMLSPVVDYIQDRLPAGVYADPADYEYTPPALRPPGALHAGGFFNACTACGSCAAACPDGVILMDGGPRIDPNVAGCRMCEGFPCVAACKTGALALTDRAALFMGLAVWDPSHCVLIADQPCEACRDACPLGAVEIGDAYVDVDADKCTGCGLCQQACPLAEKGIVVEPY